MTTYEAKSTSLEVLADEQGYVLAAVLRSQLPAAATPNVDAPPETSIVPLEGQVLHKISIPESVAAEELFATIHTLVVRTDQYGLANLIPRADS
jgi:hypothetical protein